MEFIRKLLGQKPKNAGPSLEQISYSLAYSLLPEYAFRRNSEILKMCQVSSRVGAAFFYVLTLKACFNIECDEQQAQDAQKFHWHLGQLGSGRHYFALEYPQPAPIDHLGEDDLMAALTGGQGLVLAPYFSVVVGVPNATETELSEVEYFVLGQRPMGGSTLRRVTGDGQNQNLGRGPEPALDLFIEAVSAVVGQCP